MIDLHCHILTGVDDGAKDIEESVAMARVLHEQGFNAVVATPHIAESENLKTPADKIKEMVADLNRLLESEDIPVKVYPGAEYHLDRPLPELIRHRFPIATLADSWYMLIELPMMHWPNYLEYSVWPEDSDPDKLRKFLPYIRPVIAHPERNQEVMRDYTRLKKLRDHGYLFQVNLESIVGWGGRHTIKTVKKMAKAGLVDLVGTDGHHSEKMAELLPGWRRQVEKVLGKKPAELALEINPCLEKNIRDRTSTR
jgi:protein-tyrosine phosphatase